MSNNPYKPFVQPGDCNACYCKDVLKTSRKRTHLWVLEWSNKPKECPKHLALRYSGTGDGTLIRYFLILVSSSQSAFPTGKKVLSKHLKPVLVFFLARYQNNILGSRSCVEVVAYTPLSACGLSNNLAHTFPPFSVGRKSSSK